MALEKIVSLAGRAVHVPGADIDTDRIIPARFLKCVTFDGLGEAAFYDVRFDESGAKTEHPLNDVRFDDASIMLVGPNFGCGSSREHAPQSLNKRGFKAIIGESFAEIFFSNSTNLAMPCVTAAKADLDALKAAVEAEPTIEVTINLQTQRVTSSAGHDFACSMPETARAALVHGRWDPIQELLDNEAATHAKAKELHYI